MKKIQTEFKQQCIDIFGEQGDFVYEFYKSLKTSIQSKQDKLMSLTERRTRSLSYLVEHFGKDAILNTITSFNKKREAGELTVNTIPYFNKVVENYTLPTSKVPTQGSLFKQPIQRKRIEPVKLRLAENHSYEEDIFNWIYQCSNCKSEYTAWDEDCPTCKSGIGW
jgi:hypothetical protein